MRILVLAASLCVGVTLGQQYPTTTPVPILKQINRHNEDGSYSYGFEAADGSYKIESKHPNGEVYGKYGFVDDTGSVREIEYGATRRGFEPHGTGINVPPPTLQGNSIAEGKDDPEDDGQYREDPSIYYTDPRFTNGERYDPVPKTPIYNHQLQQRPLGYNPPTPSIGIEYGATRRGFEPHGTGINVPPPTLQGNSIAEGKDDPEDDGQYREDPSIYYTDPRFTNGESRLAAAAYRPAPAPAPARAAAPAIAAQYQVQYNQPEYPQYQAQAAQQYQPQYQTQYQPQYQTQYQPEYKNQVQRQLPAAPQYRQPAQYDSNQFRGHPASRVDLNLGSYSVNYRR